MAADLPNFDIKKCSHEKLYQTVEMSIVLDCLIYHILIIVMYTDYVQTYRAGARLNRRSLKATFVISLMHCKNGLIRQPKEASQNLQHLHTALVT